MEREYGREIVAIMCMLEIGSEIGQRGMEHIHGQMEIDMMGNGLLVKNREREQISLLMGILMWESIQRENLMDKEYIIGLQGVSMRESSEMD